MSLSIKLEPVLGSQILDTIESAFKVAVSLDLAYAEFDFNGANVAVYPNGTAMEIDGVLDTRRTWRRVGRQGWMAQ